MKEDLQLKLQAYLDGELSASEAKSVTSWLAKDAAARHLFVELTNTRAALLSHEPDIKLPESREFYWSKIRRQIDREETVAPAVKTISIMERIRRLLVPASAVAAMMIGLMVIQNQLGQGGYAAFEASGVHEDSETFTYRDYESGTTLVWLSYPAENEFAETDTDDTLDFN